MPIGIEKETFLRLREIRGALSQKKFAKILGVNQATVCKYESGRLPDALTLKKIADYGKVTVEWLLNGEQAQAKLLEPDEAITIESPTVPSVLHSPGLFGYVDKTAVTQIVEAMEELLSHRKRRPKPVKYGLWLSLLYDKFQETGRIPDQDMVKEFLRQVD